LGCVGRKKMESSANETVAVEITAMGTDSILTENRENMRKEMQHFAFHVWAKLDANESYIFSPYSVQMLFTMLLNGAEGETAREMMKALDMDSMGLTGYNTIYYGMMRQMPQLDGNVTLNIANAMIVNEKVPLKSKFVKDAETYYKAMVENMDFTRSDRVVEKINGWCNENTNGLIPEIIDRVTPDMTACLLNAVYFKGTWSNPFEKDFTQPRPFTDESGRQSEVEMMAQEERFSYMENERMQCLSLPYGNGVFRMYVLLPKPGGKVADLVAWLDADKWMGIKEVMRNRKVDVWMPKFETKYHKQLNALLKDLGMKKAFSAGAEFGKFSSVPSYISMAQQDALIKVYEEGSEAAAVTSIVMKTTSMERPTPPVVFHADHPFLYLIEERESGAILFMGRYNGR
jgi:serpin B